MRAGSRHRTCARLTRERVTERRLRVGDVRLVAAIGPDSWQSECGARRQWIARATIPSVADEHARAAGSDPMIIGGIAAHPPMTRSQAERIRPLGLLADNPKGLAHAWHQVEEMWTATVLRACRLPDHSLHERVNGEWSFVETLRHLVMVTDGWIRRTVLGADPPFHRLGLPPHFITNGAELGLDADAKPSFDEVLPVRLDRLSQVRQVIDDATVEGTDGGGRARSLDDARRALQVVTFEEWAHHQFATRDLAKLEQKYG